MKHWLARPIWYLCLMVLLAGAAEPLRAAESAVILIYHRFGDSRFPSTNIRLEQFDAHIAELTSGRYHVLPLPEIVAALREGRALPDHAVGIAIDDAYMSVYRHAWPRLKKAGLPVTLFVATGPVDQGLDDYMSWGQIKELADAGVTIGNHTASHASMIGRTSAQNKRDISAAEKRFRAELGFAPRLFAYPFGEFGTREERLVRDAGFAAAFAQYSSVVHRQTGLYALPRFALNEDYGGIDRFRLVVNALPIPAHDIVPTDPVLKDNPPAFGFTLVTRLDRIDALSCYPSHLAEAATVELLGDKRVEVRFDKPFPAGRSRINCTMPGPDGRWRWLGYPFFAE